MNVDERDRRAAAGGRDGAQRMPRPGGRVAEQRTQGAPRTQGTQGDATGRRSPGGSGTTRGARRTEVHDAPVAGTAALKLDVAAPVRAGRAETAPRLHVAPPAPVSTPRAPFVAGVIALVLAGVFGILLINTKANENSFTLTSLQNEQTELDNQQQALERQIAEFESTGNLDAAARMLGLVKAAPPAFIRLQDGRIIGIPKPGEGSPAITSQRSAGQ